MGHVNEIAKEFKKLGLRHDWPPNQAVIISAFLIVAPSFVRGKITLAKVRAAWVWFELGWRRARVAVRGAIGGDL